MYANALYRRGFAKEGYRALQALADTAMQFETSKIYPGIPEYFNNQGRGMYHYLTGAASWYMLTFLTEAFGVRGRAGDLEIAPAMMEEQFDEDGTAELELTFAGKRFRIVIRNPERAAYGEYCIKSAMLDGSAIPLTETKDMNPDGKRADKAVLPRAEIERMSHEVHRIEILLGA